MYKKKNFQQSWKEEKKTYQNNETLLVKRVQWGLLHLIKRSLYAEAQLANTC